MTLTLILTLFLSFTIQADEKGKEKSTTNTIHGTVVDKVTGETLAGVEVLLEGTKQKSVSDLDGNFKFESLTPGEYKISLKYISYKEHLEEINVSYESAADLEIKLESR